jgi:hypothetical protein
MVDGQEHWTVERLLTVAGDEVEVKWTGCDSTTWEPIAQIRTDCPGLLADLLLGFERHNDQNETSRQKTHLLSVAFQLDLTAAELRRDAQEYEGKAFLARKRAAESDSSEACGTASRLLTVARKKAKLKKLLYPDKRRARQQVARCSTLCPAYKFVNLPRKTRNNARKVPGKANTDQNIPRTTAIDSSRQAQIQQLSPRQKLISKDEPDACQIFSFSCSNLRHIHDDIPRNTWPAVNNLQSQGIYMGGLISSQDAGLMEYVANRQGIQRSLVMHAADRLARPSETPPIARA